MALSFTGCVKPDDFYNHCDSSNMPPDRFLITLLAFVLLFDLVCERVLVVSFTCNPRPGEVGGLFVEQEGRQYQAAPQLLTPK